MIFTLGAMAPAQAEIDAIRNNQDYSTENSLQRAWQQQWLQEHPLGAMASDLVGFAVPDVAAGKLAMMGGRALAEQFLLYKVW